MKNPTTKEVKEEKTYAFVARAIALQNVEPEEKQKQSIISFCKRAILDVKASISKLQNDIENRELDKESALLLVEEATIAFDNARITPASNTAAYMLNRNRAQEVLVNHKNTVLRIEADITNLKAQIEDQKEVLADLEG